MRLMSLYAREGGCLDDNTQALRSWETSLGVDHLYDEQWIFAYEATTRGWLASTDEFVLNDRNFAQLAAANVQFMVLSGEHDVATVWGPYGSPF